MLIPFVVFLIGMRINRLWAIHEWWPVMNAMAPMINELMQNPELVPANVHRQSARDRLRSVEQVSIES